jgi:hypothetical protein
VFLKGVTVWVTFFFIFLARLLCKSKADHHFCTRKLEFSVKMMAAHLSASGKTGADLV